MWSHVEIDNVGTLFGITGSRWGKGVLGANEEFWRVFEVRIYRCSDVGRAVSIFNFLYVYENFRNFDARERSDECDLCSGYNER